MITQETVVEKILLHLNGKITELELVHWAEDALLELTERDDEIPNEQAVMDALMYIGAGDSPGFPLTWEVLSGYLEQFGTKVRVLAESA
ncbi:MAG: hypothetical protein K8I30_24730 [Anaerolineae bacterium]|nr:hypothetical protein [Anaerolineae bacterium]